MVKIILALVALLKVKLTYVNTLEIFDREVHYCCPMYTDKVSFLVNELFCVGVYNERRILNIDCNINSDIKIVNYNSYNISNAIQRKFCFLTEEDDELQLLVVCIEKHQIEWMFDIPFWCKCLSIVFLFMTLYGYATIETLRRPEDIPFIVFTGLLMISMITDIIKVILVRHFELKINPDIILHLQYYTKFGSFTWFNIILLYQLRENMYRGIIRPYWLFLSHLIGWTSPLIIQELIIFILPNWPYFLHFYPLTLWSISIGLLISIVSTASILPRRVCKRYRTMLKYRSRLYCKLFFITEFLWIFDFISIFCTKNVLFHLIECIVGFQGFFIFYLMIIKRYHVRKILGERNVFCLTPVENQRMISEDDSDVELVQLGCKISDV